MICIFKIILLIIIAIPVLAYIFGKIYKVDRRPDVIHYARTDDGWKIAVNQYFAAPKKGKKKRLPILICHGFTSNHLNWDLTERHSLARTIAAAGYDVFSVDLRGSGNSDRPRWFSPRKWDWDFETYLNQDLPAALEKILKVTGEKKVHWVGHSMGGMLAYAFLQKEHAPKIKSAVILSSPARLDQYKFVMPIWSIVSLLPVLHVGMLAKFVSPLAELLPFMQRTFGNLELPRGYTARAMANTVEDVPMKLVGSFARWVKLGRIVLKDGLDVSEGLASIKTPMLFMVGTSDLTCIPKSVHEAFEAVGSKKKEFHWLGPDHGQQIEYGHQSVQFGRFSDKEVYPVIIDWLERN